MINETMFAKLNRMWTHVCGSGGQGGDRVHGKDPRVYHLYGV